MNMNQNMSEGQERVIDELEQKISALTKTVSEKEKLLAKKSDKAEFYLHMQRKILGDPALVKEWEAFVIMMKLTLDRSIKGLTEPS
jgi:hypothetical protein